MALDYSYIGRGKIYLREAGAAAALVEVGNASKLDFSVEEDIKELPDYTQPGGGTYNEVRRVSSVEVSLTAHDLSPGNLARALYGTATAAVAGTVASASAETLTAYKGGLLRLAHAGPTAVTLTNSAATTTYVQGTDYEVRPGGIYILPGGTIADATTVKASYSYGAEDVVQALVTTGKTYELVFDGLNEARSGKSVVIDAWRVRLGAARTLSLIGDDYAGLELSGKVLKDTTKTGGISSYFRATLQQ